MREITLHLKFDVIERPPDGLVEKLLEDLISYLTNHENPVFEDFGPRAWGGYGGAFITDARVTRSKID